MQSLWLCWRKEITEIYSKIFVINYLVGNFDNHVLQQLGRFGGAIWISHCLNFSSANGSPGCLTNGFCIPYRTTNMDDKLNSIRNAEKLQTKCNKLRYTIANVALLSVSSKSDAASKLACSSSRRFFFIFSRCKSMVYDPYISVTLA